MYIFCIKKQNISDLQIIQKMKIDKKEDFI
jgi:hypothetical protein